MIQRVSKDLSCRLKYDFMLYIVYLSPLFNVAYL